MALGSRVLSLQAAVVGGAKPEEAWEQRGCGTQRNSLVKLRRIVQLFLGGDHHVWPGPGWNKGVLLGEVQSGAGTHRATFVQVTSWHLPTPRQQFLAVGKDRCTVARWFFISCRCTMLSRKAIWFPFRFSYSCAQALDVVLIDHDIAHRKST